MTDPAPQWEDQRLELPSKTKAIARMLTHRKASIASSAPVGRKMPDGTVYAGTLPNGRRLFAMPWDADVAMKFNAAAAYAQRLNNNKKHGHDDWHIPSKEELNLLVENRNKGALKGTFNENWHDEETDGDYWSSTRAPSGTYNLMYTQRPVDGAVSQVDVNCRAWVRCVR